MMSFGALCAFLQVFNWLFFLWLNVEAVLCCEQYVSRQCVGVADSSARGVYRIVDVGESVKQIETVDHECPSGFARRETQADVEYCVCRVQLF